MALLINPRWRKGLKEFGIWISLFISFVTLFAFSILPVVLYAEFWMLSLPPIALGIIYFGAKILMQRYENFFDSMTDEEKIDLQRRGEMPCGKRTKINLLFISIILAIATVMWLYSLHLLAQ